MFMRHGPRKRYQASPTEKKNMVIFGAFVVFIILCGMGAGWLIFVM